MQLILKMCIDKNNNNNKTCIPFATNAHKLHVYSMEFELKIKLLIN